MSKKLTIFIFIIFIGLFVTLTSAIQFFTPEDNFTLFNVEGMITFCEFDGRILKNDNFLVIVANQSWYSTLKKDNGFYISYWYESNIPIVKGRTWYNYITNNGGGEIYKDSFNLTLIVPVKINVTEVYYNYLKNNNYLHGQSPIQTIYYDKGNIIYRIIEVELILKHTLNTMSVPFNFAFGEPKAIADTFLVVLNKNMTLSNQGAIGPLYKITNYEEYTPHIHARLENGNIIYQSSSALKEEK